jgi:hypothetical protein
MLTKSKDALTDRMDEFGARLLTAAEDAPDLEDKLAVFKAVGRWVAIKHAIKAGDEKGGGLAGYRKTLRGGADKPPKRRGFQDHTPEQQRARVMRRWHPGSDSNSSEGDGGPELEAFKARLPKSSHG